MRDKDSLALLSLTYRAYGYVALEKYEDALVDIKRVKSVQDAGSANSYNK
jgi:hypothetical protein